MFAAPAWMVDKDELRSTLDRLREALQRPISVVAGAVVHDRSQIACSLRTILDRFDALDLSATSAKSIFVREFRTAAQVDQLRDLFQALQRGWQLRVARILGANKLRAAKRLLASPSPDLLRILGREDDENSHSDVIAWLLTPKRAPTVAPRALRKLVSTFEDADRWSTHLDARGNELNELISVRREVRLGRELARDDDRCRIDILVSGPGFVLALENKVWSHEHSDQTVIYWSWLEPMTCLRAGLFVSPSGLTACCPGFVSISYLDLVSALLEAPANGQIDPTEEIVLASYLKTLSRSILPVEMRALVEAAHSLEDE
jgi:hypothetical protein